MSGLESSKKEAKAKTKNIIDRKSEWDALRRNEKFKTLSRRDRDMLWAYYSDGETVTRIAEYLDMSRHGVRKVLQRIKESFGVVPVNAVEPEPKEGADADPAGTYGVGGKTAGAQNNKIKVQRIPANRVLSPNKENEKLLNQFWRTHKPYLAKLTAEERNAIVGVYRDYLTTTEVGKFLGRNAMYATRLRQKAELKLQLLHMIASDHSPIGLEKAGATITVVTVSGAGKLLSRQLLFITGYHRVEDGEDGVWAVYLVKRKRGETPVRQHRTFYPAPVALYLGWHDVKNIKDVAKLTLVFAVT